MQTLLTFRWHLLNFYSKISGNPAVGDSPAALAGFTTSGKAPRHGGAFGGSNQEQNMFYVYVLESERDSKFYIGQTNNLEERLAYHNRGMVTATRNRRPLKIVYREGFESRAEAMQREKYLKSLKNGNQFKKITGLS